MSVSEAKTEGRLEAAAEYVRPADLVPNDRNPRDNEGAVRDVIRSIEAYGFGAPIVARRQDSVVIAGHTRLKAALKLGLEEVPVRFLDLSEAEATALMLVDNRTGETALWTEELGDLLAQLLDEDLEVPGFDPEELERLIHGEDAPSGEEIEARASLLERFGVPPFSVLDSRQGYWMTRRRAWIALGIESEIGREEKSLIKSDSGRDPSFYLQKRTMEALLGRSLSTEEFLRSYYSNQQGGGGLSQTGTSVFDPVLCELAVRWFCPPGGSVLDPFAGGSVRGIVAGKTGRSYLGVDLREEQVRANRKQAERIFRVEDVTSHVTSHVASHEPEEALPPGPDLEEDPDALTPVEKVGDIYVKRDDLFGVLGVNGGKVRACLRIARCSIAVGLPDSGLEVRGLTTAGARQSITGQVVAAVAAHLGLPASYHTSAGEETPEMSFSRSLGCEIIQHPAGRMVVLRARAREDAEARGYLLIPFGMEHEHMVEGTRKQVANLPLEEVERLVVCVGGGMSLAGILHGLDDRGRGDLPVLGVQVGSLGTEDRLEDYAPADFRERVVLEESPLPYTSSAPERTLGPILLDGVYEAKVIPFLRPGDLFWIVAIRPTEGPAEDTPR